MSVKTESLRGALGLTHWLYVRDKDIKVSEPVTAFLYSQYYNGLGKVE